MEAKPFDFKWTFGGAHTSGISCFGYTWIGSSRFFLFPLFLFPVSCTLLSLLFYYYSLGMHMSDLFRLILLSLQGPLP